MSNIPMRKARTEQSTKVRGLIKEIVEELVVVKWQRLGELVAPRANRLPGGFVVIPEDIGIWLMDAEHAGDIEIDHVTGLVWKPGARRNHA